MPFPTAGARTPSPRKNPQREERILRGGLGTDTRTQLSQAHPAEVLNELLWTAGSCNSASVAHFVDPDPCNVDCRKELVSRVTGVFGNKAVVDLTGASAEKVLLMIQAELIGLVVRLQHKGRELSNLLSLTRQ